MFRTALLLAATLTCGFLTPAADAAEARPAAPVEADVRLLLDTIRANRRALVAVNLHLTNEQAAQFWPLYDRYQEEIAATGDRAAAVIQDYTANFSALSNEKALQLVDQYLAAEADRIKVRRDYLPQFTAILPGRTVARLYQIENKLDAVIRYDLASTIPVVEESAAPQP